jgi:uncharacterized protein (DUF488 family)
MTDPIIIFTVGHSNHSLDRLLELLAAHEIELVADVRSHPRSKYATHFNRENLAGTLGAAGHAYEFLGAELGGRPEGSVFYDHEGHVLYDRVAETDAFAEGVARVEEAALRLRVALMCSEENPSGCHRRLLVSRVLGAHGVDIRHIRGDGSVVREDELRAAELATTAQASLFDDSVEEPWRSIQSVSRRRALRSSLSS